MKLKWILLAAVLVLAFVCAGCTGDTSSANTGAQYTDVSSLTAEAQTLYQQGSYSESLEKFLSAMESNPKDMDARLGAAWCQIQLENYQIAVMNLTMAQQIDPSLAEYCDLYAALSKKTGDLSYSNTAVDLAHTYNHEAFLERVPSSPVIVTESGTYGEPIQLEITHSDPEAIIHVDVMGDNYYSSLYNMVYTAPITLRRGSIDVCAYTIKDGIPSEYAFASFFIDYPPVEITFQDPYIEQIVRTQLNNFTDPITDVDCEQVNMLDWYMLYETCDNFQEYEKMQIQSLADLQYLPCVEYINLDSQTCIQDFSPLAYCPMLYDLSLYNCNLTDTDFVKYAPNVAYLYLSDNQISDASGLYTLTNLQGLDIANNQDNLKLDTVIQNNPMLNYVRINDTYLSDYNLLATLPNLTSLGIAGVEYADFSALGQLTNLCYLDISYNSDRMEYRNRPAIEDLSFLDSLQNLEALDLVGVHDPSQLQHIHNLSHLMNLMLYYCDATDNQEAMRALTQALPNCNIGY